MRLVTEQLVVLVVLVVLKMESMHPVETEGPLAQEAYLEEWEVQELLTEGMALIREEEMAVPVETTVQAVVAVAALEQVVE